MEIGCNNPNPGSPRSKSLRSRSQSLRSCIAHPRLFPLAFDRISDIKSRATISLKELHQLYQQSKTEKERDRCFDPRILYGLRTNNLNEVVYMDMDSDNQFFILFYQHFVSLIGKIKGNLLPTFVDLEAFNNHHVKLCAVKLSSKLERGDKLFCFGHRPNIPGVEYQGHEIRRCIPRFYHLLLAEKQRALPKTSEGTLRSKY